MKSLPTKKYLLHGLLVALGIVGYNLTGCQGNSGTCGADNDFPPHPIRQGVSAPFAGFIGNRLVVGGGCNFPDTPAAEGGKKVFYADVFACSVGTSEGAASSSEGTVVAQSLQWNPLASLPLTVAYGSSAETPLGLVCMGGTNTDGALKKVFICKQGAKGLLWESLPDLPENIDNAASTSLGNRVFVTGGNQENGGNALYTLQLPTDTTWTKLTDYPGPKRIQPVLLASDDALFLFGGFEVNPTSKETIISNNYLVYRLTDKVWSEPNLLPAMADGSPRALVGAAGTRIGGKLYLAGGVNYAIFKDAVEGKAPANYMTQPADWYQFSKDILVYDVASATWEVIPHVDGFNKAGGCLLHQQGSLYMVCGEIKPGIRTSEIVKRSVKALLGE